MRILWWKIRVNIEETIRKKYEKGSTKMVSIEKLEKINWDSSGMF